MLLGAIAAYAPLMLLEGVPFVFESFMTSVSDTLVFFIFPLLWLLYKMRNHNLKFTSFLVKPKSFNWKLIIAATAMMMVFSFGISTIQFYIVSYLAPNFLLDMLNAEDLISNESIFAAIYSVISVSVYAPIMEELIFRGFFLHRMTYKWGLKRAIIFSSLLFGLGHMDIIGAAAFGIVMCLIYLKTNSLLVCMAVHALNNLAVSAMQIGGDAIYGEAAPLRLADLRSETDLAIGIGLTVLGLLWIVPFIRKSWRNAAEKGLPPLKSRYPAQMQDNGVYSQVLIANHFMAVELPDEIANKLKLEENDYVRLEMQDDKVILTKATESRPKIS